LLASDSGGAVGVPKTWKATMDSDDAVAGEPWKVTTDG
jgi:hypothetical protein